ncbi:MAG: hypothetical protein M3O30_16445 [Planctomycetota bacterium]|nr:hypothetical protein [Planctomycetota bacterium]
MPQIEYSTQVSTTRLRGRRRLVVVAVVLCAVVWFGYRLSVKTFGAAAEDTSKMVFASASIGDMEITIRHTGELAAMANKEVHCELEGDNTIQDITKEGTYVHKGDVICTLDSAEIRHKLETATIDYHKSESDLTWAQEQVAIQQSKNDSDLEAATVELALARLDLREYIEGKYPADLKNAQREEEMAEINLKDKETALAHTRALLEKSFVTAEDEKKAEVDKLTAENDLEKKKTDLDVLVRFTHEKDATDKKNKVAQAEQKVEHTKTENASNLNQKTADLDSKNKARDIGKYEMEHLQKELDFCTIKAPGDGIMLYGPEQRVYYSDESRQIQAGGKVFENQTIARLPDISQMKVVVRLSESEVPGIRADANNKMHARVNITGYAQPLWAWVSVIPPVPDSARRWWDPDAKEYAIDLTLDQTPAGLKPGASAEAELFVKHLDRVLTVPLDSIYHAGADTYCFALRDGKVQPRKVTVGESSRTAVQVLSGLTDGEKVLLLGAGQGRDLLDKAGIKPPAATEPSPTAPPSMATVAHSA